MSADLSRWQERVFVFQVPYTRVAEGSGAAYVSLERCHTYSVDRVLRRSHMGDPEVEVRTPP